jgi:hypothetical protein
MNLREVIEKSKVTSTSCGADYGLTMVVSVDQANVAIRKALAMQLDALIESMEKDIQKERFSGVPFAFNKYIEKLKQAREDITSLQ